MKLDRDTTLQWSVSFKGSDNMWFVGTINELNKILLREVKLGNRQIESIMMREDTGETFTDFPLMVIDLGDDK